MINRVVLIGRLTKDIELRYTQGGTAVGTFSLAVNRQFTNSAGEREADFINAVIWRKGAEILTNYTHKGSLIGIEGHIQTRNYENQQGTRVYVTEVVVENFSLLESRGDNNERQNGTGFEQGTQKDGGFGGQSNSSNNATRAHESNGRNNQPQQQPNAGTGQTVADGATNYAQPNIVGGQTNNIASSNTQQPTGFGQGNPFGANGQEIDINDDDLPF